MAQLQCDYDLGNDTLYSVKWYKEHEEFYRFVPKAHPQANSYKVEGVHVDVSYSVLVVFMFNHARCKSLYLQLSWF